MKYRALYPEELDNLRDDFVQFLSSNSITSDDWVALKSGNPEQANRLVELFSDLVWEKVLGRIEYLEARTQNELRVMHFGKEKILMVVLKIMSEDFDFTNVDHIRSIAEGTVDLMKFEPEVYRGARDYGTEKSMEVFVLMEQGARPCKEAFWKAIVSMLPPEGEK